MSAADNMYHKRSDNMCNDMCNDMYHEHSDNVYRELYLFLI